MFYEQGITIFDSTAVAGATTGSFVTYGGASIFNTTQSTGITSGALVVRGGVGISGTMNAVNSNWSGIMRVTNTKQSTSTSDGAFVLDGGAGIAKDLNVGGNATITGNLFVNGTTTSVESTTVTVSDNTFQINTGPIGTRDAGFLIGRFQEDNNTSSGDVVSDTPAFTDTVATGNSTTEIVFPASFSTTVDLYKYWWIEITSGAAVGQVRQITAYSAGRVATLSSALTAAPTDTTDTFSLFNKNYVAHYYDTVSDSYIFGYTSHNVDITTDIYDAGQIDIKAKGGLFTSVTAPNFVSTNISAGTLNLSTGLTSASALITAATITNLRSTNVTTATLNATGGITSGTALITSATIPTLLSTNISSGTLDLSTGLTSASALITAATIPTLLSTNVSTTYITSTSAVITNGTVSTLNSTNISAGTANLSVGITSATALLTTATIPTLLSVNATTSTLNVITG